MAKSADVRDRIEEYRRLCERDGPEAALAATRKALADRHYLLVARAAELAGERLLYDLEPDLIAAYRRFLDNPVKRDPNCTAKGAIARALVALDCLDARFYLAGIRYRQLEPVWGGSVDTAVDLRVSCAIGLAATAYPRALIPLVDLLHDPEPHCRSGAVRAIACTQPLAAEAVLRSKALGGDPEPDVTGDCLIALLQVAAEDALDFVAGFLDAPDPTVRELAALALGDSHLDPALDLLREHWEAQPLKRDADRVLLRAAALHRSEAAFDWLIQVAARGDPASAELVVEELAAYRANEKLRERLRSALAERGDLRLVSDFDERFRAREGRT
jgi:HEAT repeat protein